MSTRRVLEAALLGIAAAAILASWLYVQPEVANEQPKLSERPAKRAAKVASPASVPAPLPEPEPVAAPAPPPGAPGEPTVEKATDKLVIIEAIGEEQGWDPATLDGVLSLYASADETTEAILTDMRSGSVSEEAGQAELLDVREQLREGLAELLTEEERERLHDSMRLPRKVFSVPE